MSWLEGIGTLSPINLWPLFKMIYIYDLYLTQKELRCLYLWFVSNTEREACFSVKRWGFDFQTFLSVVVWDWLSLKILSFIFKMKIISFLPSFLVTMKTKEEICIIATWTLESIIWIWDILTHIIFIYCRLHNKSYILPGKGCRWDLIYCWDHVELHKTPWIFSFWFLWS